jgi:hypothetical protein
MPEQVLKSMKPSIQKFVDAIADFMFKFNYFETVRLEEQTLVSDLYFRIENL